MPEEKQTPDKRIVIDVMVDGQIDYRFSNKLKRHPITHAELTRIIRGLKISHRTHLAEHRKRINEEDRQEEKEKKEKEKEAVNA